MYDLYDSLDELDKCRAELAEARSQAVALRSACELACEYLGPPGAFAPAPWSKEQLDMLRVALAKACGE